MSTENTAPVSETPATEKAAEKSMTALPRKAADFIRGHFGTRTIAGIAYYTIPVADFDALVSDRTRTSSDKLETLLGAMIAALNVDAPDNAEVSTFKIPSKALRGLGLPETSYRSAPYWRASNSAAARFLVNAGWSPVLVSVYDEESDSSRSFLQITRGPGAAADIVKLRAAFAKADAEAAKNAPAASEPSAAPAVPAEE